MHQFAKTQCRLVMARHITYQVDRPCSGSQCVHQLTSSPLDNAQAHYRPLEEGVPPNAQRLSELTTPYTIPRTTYSVALTLLRQFHCTYITITTSADYRSTLRNRRSSNETINLYWRTKNMFYKPYLPNKTPEPPSKCAARTRTPRPMTSTGSFCLPILIAS